MRLNHIIFLTKLFLFAAITHVYSQGIQLCPTSNSKKAIKYYEDALAAKKSKKDYEAVKILVMKSVAEDTSFAAPWLFMGNTAWQKRDYPLMKKAYTRLIELCPDADEYAYYHLGVYLYDTKKYDEASGYLKSYLDFGSLDETKNKEVETMLFRANMRANPVPFNPEIVKGISTPDPEYLAIISPDNEYCYFTRRYEEFRKGSLTPRYVERFMVSKRQSDSEFEKGEPIPLPFNQTVNNNEGGASISKDNRFIYFTRNDGGNFDLYYSEFIKGKWGEIKNLGPEVNDPKQWDSQPSIAPDGKTLYFASYRDSLYGTCDIFYTTKENGVFTPPKGLPFNTNGNEKSPFIHPDNTTLYFSSDSLPGMGGFDIFMVKKDGNGKWGKPVNLGYPINTEADEVGFFVSTEGSKGYFASDKLAGAGGYDIYSFDMPEDKKPERVLFVKGQIKNEKDEISLAAKIEIRNILTSEIFDVDYDTLTGNYASVVLFDADYIMTVKKDGYAYNSQYFAQDDSTIIGVVTKDMDARKMEIGEAYKLNDILFATNSSSLTRSTVNIILDFASFLKENTNLKVAIHGHTDNEGDAATNMKLSHERAKAVYDFLVTTGLSASRLSYNGFGQTKPVASNDNQDGRAKNRRTEFVITGK